MKDPKGEKLNACTEISPTPNVTSSTEPINGTLANNIPNDNSKTKVIGVDKSFIIYANDNKTTSSNLIFTNLVIQKT